jgi:hypothetical protein
VIHFDDENDRGTCPRASSPRRRSGPRANAAPSAP